MVDHVLKIETLAINLKPYAMARMSEGLFKSSQNYHSEKMPVLNYFLLCASIELGLKSYILNINNSSENNQIVKNYGHDLEQVYRGFMSVNKVDKFFLNQEEINTVSKINPYFKSKGLEYFVNGMMFEMATALSGFPELEDLIKVASKVNKLLESYSFFNGADLVDYEN